MAERIDWEEKRKTARIAKTAKDRRNHQFWQLPDFGNFGDSHTGYPAAHALARYRCFLPDLAGLAGLSRAGPGRRHFNTFVSAHRRKRLCARKNFGENKKVGAS